MESDLQPMYLQNLSSSSSSAHYTDNIFPFSLNRMDHINRFNHHPEYQARTYDAVVMGNQSMELADSSSTEQLVMYDADDNHHDNNNNNNNNNMIMMMNNSCSNNIIGGDKLRGEGDLKNSNTSGSHKKMRKHRYAFQTRSQVDILDDGYRWRKYGQKAVKNNKFPRSYYRCTYQGCGVKKQVQRLSKDEAVVVTTYEGVHSHPIEKSTDNFEHILSRMQIYPSYPL